jgi:hypothetical protein
MGGAFADAVTQQQVLQEGIDFYNTVPDQCDTVTTSSVSTAANGVSNGQIWDSSTQPPYYLESFIINVLEDIATKLSVPEADAVTQQHVLAMVAWAYAEGGNIANTDIFNPWNNGLDDPALLSGANNGSGVESFNSFNSGVEANAIVMTAPNQSRIGQILINPDSSATDVLFAIANYPNFPGNQLWASDPIPDYYASLTANLSQAENNYTAEASVEIGPGEENTAHVPASELQFNGAAGASAVSSPSSNGGCCSGQTTTTSTSTSSSGTLGANAQPAFSYLIQHGFTPTETAAMVGNWQQESGINPAEPGGGLAQWGGARYTAMLAYVTAEGKEGPSMLLDGQIDFVIHELNTTYTAALNALQTDSDNITSATTDFMNLYEKPDAQLANLAGRITYAQDALTEFGGTAATASSSGSDCGASLTSTNSVDGYTNPLRSVQDLRPERVDQGVDYAGYGAVYAMGPGVIHNLTNSGWNFGGYDAFITYQLTAGPANGDYVYVAEGCVPAAGLAIGQTVTTSTVLCDMINPTSTGIETGWAEPPGAGTALAQANGGYQEGYSTELGLNYNQLLVALHAPSGNPIQQLMGSLPANWPTWPGSGTAAE